MQCEVDRSRAVWSKQKKTKCIYLFMRHNTTISLCDKKVRIVGRKGLNNYVLGVTITI